MCVCVCERAKMKGEEVGDSIDLKECAWRQVHHVETATILATETVCVWAYRTIMCKHAMHKQRYQAVQI